MLEALSCLINNKSVLLLGFGMEGKSTFNLLKKIGGFKSLDIADANLREDVPGSNVYSGVDYLGHIAGYDIAFKSPGVVLPGKYRNLGCVITSQTEQFLTHYREQIIAITGTKGKSTVSSLLYHVLSVNNIPCLLAGNIGKPVFDILDDIKADTRIILELSSHQLEFCNVSPAVAVFLNIFEDHLDHYASFDDYLRAKKNIYLHQKPQDVLYCIEATKPAGMQVGITGAQPDAADKTAAQVICVNRELLPFKSMQEVTGLRLRGLHNIDNCAFVYSICQSFSINDEQFITALQSYIPLPHRIEYIGSKNGVDYYDDSISTTVESAISALESVDNASTVLLGGMDRGINYAALTDYLALSKLTNVICMYESGKRIYDMLRCYGSINPALIYCDNLAQAVKTALEVTPKGTACILSPASASYGDFKDFNERGEFYKKLIFDS